MTLSLSLPPLKIEKAEVNKTKKKRLVLICNKNIFQAPKAFKCIGKWVKAKMEHEDWRRKKTAMMD